MHNRPSSFLDTIVGACISVLVAAVALYVAVHLIEAVWRALLGIVAVGTIIGVAVLLLRGRSYNDW